MFEGVDFILVIEIYLIKVHYDDCIAHHFMPTQSMKRLQVSSGSDPRI